MDFTYNYGTSTTNTGRVLSRTDGIQSEHSANYTYDSIYRLSQANSADSSWGISWTFDTWGNRLTQTPTGLATSKVGSQTSGYNNNRNTSFTYDAAGNQLNDGLHNYTFNAENQITQMDAGTATYAYDGDGRRMKKTAASETTYTFYGPGGILSEFTTSNALSAATSAVSTDKCFYHTTEKLGSAVLLLNGSGVVIENNRVLPYGEAWLAESTPSTNDKKFTTYQRDQESGLDYAEDRYDASANGRFLSVDRGAPLLHQPRSLNRYVYAINDPINFRDSTGKSPEPEELICAFYYAGAPVVHGDPSGFCGGSGAGSTYLDTGVMSGAVNIGNGPDIYNSLLVTLIQTTGYRIVPVLNPTLSATLGRALSSVLLGLQGSSAAAKDCLSWLGSNGDDVFAAEYNLRPATFADITTGAPVTTVGAGVPTGSNYIWINETSAFSNAGFTTPLGNAGNTAAAQAEILIHEIAHVYGLIEPDGAGSSPGAQTRNADVINRNCGAFISSFSGSSSF